MSFTFEDLRAKYPRLIRPNFSFECEEGWIEILDAYFAVVDHFLSDTAVYELRQVKEKFGGLRIYDHCPATAASREILDAHALAEARSLHTCEYCGRPGRFRRRRGYMTVTCLKHALRFGVYAAPEMPEPRDNRQTTDGWVVYDPEIDAFIATEPPEWA